MNALLAAALEGVPVNQLTCAPAAAGQPSSVSGNLQVIWGCRGQIQPRSPCVCSLSQSPAAPPGPLLLSSLCHRFGAFTDAEIFESYINLGGRHRSWQVSPVLALTERVRGKCGLLEAVLVSRVRGGNSHRTRCWSPARASRGEKRRSQESGEFIRLYLAGWRPSGYRSSPTTSFPGW